MAFNRLKKHCDYPQSYTEDLESLFYVMCFLLTIYDGPCYIQKKHLPGAFDELDVVLWGGQDGMATAELYCFKRESVGSVETRVIAEIAPFFEVFKDCLRRLHELLFSPDPYEYSSCQRRYRYEEKKAALEKQHSDCKQEELPDIKRSFNEEIKIYDRPSNFVFESFLEAFENTAEEVRKRDAAKEKAAEVDPKQRKQEATETAPVVDETEENVTAATEQSKTHSETKDASPRIVAPVVVDQDIHPMPNPRKRRGTENEEVERSRCKRNKPAAAPLQPSAAANIPLVQVAANQVNEKHGVPDEFEMQGGKVKTALVENLAMDMRVT